MCELGNERVKKMKGLCSQYRHWRQCLCCTAGHKPVTGRQMPASLCPDAVKEGEEGPLSVLGLRSVSIFSLPVSISLCFFKPLLIKNSVIASCNFSLCQYQCTFNNNIYFLNNFCFDFYKIASS